MGIRKDLLVNEEIAESSDSGRLPLSSRVSDCLATPLALASSWKSKGAARRIVKDKGSGLIKPIETHRKRTDQCKELEDSDAAKQRSPGLCRDKAEVSARSHKQLVSPLRQNLEFRAVRPRKMKVVFRVLREAVRMFL